MVTTGRTDPQLNAFAAMLMTGNSALWSFMTAVVIRMPHSGLIWLMGPVLCTVGALGETNRNDRMRALFLNLTLMGLLQFGFAALRSIPLALVIALPSAVLITGKRDTGSNAGCTLCASLLNLTESDVGAAAEMLSMTLALAILIPLSDRLLDFLLFGNDEWRGTGKKTPLRTTALLRRMTALAAASALMFALDWQYGHWIPLITALSYSGGDSAAELRGNWRDRLCGAFVGLCVSLLWLSTVCYIDYRFSYFSVAILLAAFYYSVRTGDRTGFCIMYMMICSTLDDIVRGASPLYGNGWQLFLQATAGVAIGASIVALIEAEAAAPRVRPRGSPPRSTAGHSAPCEY